MSIEVTHISYTYMAHTSLEHKALDDVSFRIDKGEFVALIGHTGSGKSTLAEHLNGLLHPDTGTVCVDGVDLKGKTPEARKARGKVGMVFQYPEHQLFAESIYEDIAFGPRNQGRTPDEVDAAVRAAMAFVNLDYDEFAARSPFQLSGGQMRRVAIAGVVAMEPDYLIMSGGRLHLDGPARQIFTNDKEKLRSLSMDIPESVKLAEELKAGGLPLKGTPLTREELIRAIEEAKGWKRC